jgi:uncharacterized protein (TIGR03067 family)
MHTPTTITHKTSMQVFVLSLLLIETLAAAAGEKPDAKAIEGAWAPVKAELAGQSLPAAVLKTISLNLDGGKYEVSVAGEPDKGTYTLNSSTKPKSMVITGTEGPNKGKTFPAIYDLEGDVLRVCYDLSGKQRPAEFKTAAGTQLYLVTYHRANK